MDKDWRKMIEMEKCIVDPRRKVELEVIAAEIAETKRSEKRSNCC